LSDLGDPRHRPATGDADHRRARAGITVAENEPAAIVDSPNRSDRDAFLFAEAEAAGTWVLLAEGAATRDRRATRAIDLVGRLIEALLKRALEDAKPAALFAGDACRGLARLPRGLVASR